MRRGLRLTTRSKILCALLFFPLKCFPISICSLSELDSVTSRQFQRKDDFVPILPRS
jgi:hypothetical protein